MSHPLRTEVDILQMRMRGGFGGPRAMDDAYSTMVIAHDLLGRLMAEVERLDRLATCDCGDQFTADDPGTCSRCKG